MGRFKGLDLSKYVQNACLRKHELANWTENCYSVHTDNGSSWRAPIWTFVLQQCLKPGYSLAGYENTFARWMSIVEYRLQVSAGGKQLVQDDVYDAEVLADIGSLLATAWIKLARTQRTTGHVCYATRTWPMQGETARINLC